MAVDERIVTEAVAGLELKGNEEGLIPAFGLYLTKHFSDYYNRISYGLVGAFIRELPELEEDAIALLTEAGHVCAFHTFGGIMVSVEWDAVVQPMIETREDWVKGMIGVVNALGWGRYSIIDLVPSERLVARIEESYEATGHLEAYGKAATSRCFLAAGGLAGLMNLIYHGDITKRPALTDDYYHEVFGHPHSFRSRETRCRAAGDTHCEIVVERQTT
ncbi:MAG TPA: 4-vinyl reductase [Polyangium sp.]|nr:4-vinyl reductase [Polyangium sp.]